MKHAEGKIKTNEPTGGDATKNSLQNLNEGFPSQSAIDGSEDTQTSSGDTSQSLFINWRCIDCRRISYEEFEKKLKLFEKLPLAERLTGQIAYRHELDVSYSLHHQDLIGVLDKMITYNKEKREEELSLQASLQKKDEEANRLIHPETAKLELDVDEGELAEIMRDFILTARNKKGNQVYRDTNVKYAQWICDTIILPNRKKLNYQTILKGLSKTAHLKKQRGFDRN